MRFSDHHPPFLHIFPCVLNMVFIGSYAPARPHPKNVIRYLKSPLSEWLMSCQAVEGNKYNYIIHIQVQLRLFPNSNKPNCFFVALNFPVPVYITLLWYYFHVAPGLDKTARAARKAGRPWALLLRPGKKIKKKKKKCFFAFLPHLPSQNVFW